MKPNIVFLVLEHSVGDDWENTAVVAASRSSDTAYGYKQEAERIEAERKPINGLVMRHYQVQYLELIG